MKKLSMLLMMLIMGMSVCMGQILKGDMDDDGKLTVKDVATLVETVTGKASQKYITVDSTPIKLASGESIWLSYVDGVFKLNYAKGTVYNVKTLEVDGGNVTGASTVKSGESVTLTATPNLGYKFSGWYNGNTLLSTNNPYTFTPISNITITPKFEVTTIYKVYAGCKHGYTSSVKALSVDELKAISTEYEISSFPYSNSFNCTDQNFFILFKPSEVELQSCTYSNEMGTTDVLTHPGLINKLYEEEGYQLYGMRNDGMAQDNPQLFKFTFTKK